MFITDSVYCDRDFIFRLVYRVGKKILPVFFTDFNVDLMDTA